MHAHVRIGEEDLVDKDYFVTCARSDIEWLLDRERREPRLGGANGGREKHERDAQWNN